MRKFRWLVLGLLLLGLREVDAQIVSIAAGLPFPNHPFLFSDNYRAERSIAGSVGFYLTDSRDVSVSLAVQNSTFSVNPNPFQTITWTRTSEVTSAEVEVHFIPVRRSVWLYFLVSGGVAGWKISGIEGVQAGNSISYPGRTKVTALWGIGAGIEIPITERFSWLLDVRTDVSVEPESFIFVPLRTGLKVAL